MCQHALPRLHLDDLTVDQRFESIEHVMDIAQITSFASNFDPQPFHLDEEAAEATLFRGLAASGWHTAAVTMKLLVASLPLEGGLIGAEAQVQWPRPTRAGDRLRVVSKVVDVTPSRSKPDRGIVTFECITLNQEDAVCQRMVTKLVVHRKPGQASIHL